MHSNQPGSKPSGALQNWLITLALIFISFFGVILALICIYSLPDGTTRPLMGSYFFIGSVVVLVFLLLLRWKKEKAVELAMLRGEFGGDSRRVVMREGISEKILKWIVTICCLFFVFDSIAMALICIHALPDKTTQPAVGAVYFLGGAIVLATLFYVVWKSGVSDQR